MKPNSSIFTGMALTLATFTGLPLLVLAQAAPAPAPLTPISHVATAQAELDQALTLIRNQQAFIATNAPGGTNTPAYQQLYTNYTSATNQLAQAQTNLTAAQTQIVSLNNALGTAQNQLNQLYSALNGFNVAAFTPQTNSPVPIPAPVNGP